METTPLSRDSSDVSNNSHVFQRMLYDSLDDITIESPVKSPVHMFKRSVSYIHSTQSVSPLSTTTWYQQSCPAPEYSKQGEDSESDGSIKSSQLINIRLKLEEKRRQIENNKHKIKSLMNNQRTQIGKAAFLQIISGNSRNKVPSPIQTYMPINQNSFSYNDLTTNTSQDVIANSYDKGFFVAFEDKETPKRLKPPLRTKKILSKDKNLTQVLNKSVSLNNLDLSSTNFNDFTNNGKSKEFSTPVKFTSESSVLRDEIKQHNKEEKKQFRAMVLEQNEIKKHTDESEKEWKTVDKYLLNSSKTNHSQILSGPPRLQTMNSQIQHDSNSQEIITKTSDKGFFVSFDDNETPKRPKPPLRMKKIISKDRNSTQVLNNSVSLNNLDSSRHFNVSINNGKSLEFSIPVKSAVFKDEIKQRKKDEEKKRRAVILEQYKIKKATEECDRGGKTLNKHLLNSLKTNRNQTSSGQPKLQSKPKKTTEEAKREGKVADKGLLNSSKANLKQTLGGPPRFKTLDSQITHNYYYGSQESIIKTWRSSASSLCSRSSSCDQDSLLYRCSDTDSGLGWTTTPKRITSPPDSSELPICCKFEDRISQSSGSDYGGTKLYKQLVTKSNRSIMLNAVEYCVFPGVVNQESKIRVINEINKSEAKHFLMLFRDTRFQFRALYLYFTETEKVTKLYGIGPRVITDSMFDKFFKYNSGSKCFSEIHTKHLAVTIDAFTIHNSLWQGKKVKYPSKKTMTPVV